MNKLRRAAALAALGLVCMLAAAPPLHAAEARPAPGGLAIFDAGGWLGGWLQWLTRFFERRSASGGPLAGATGDVGGCVDPNGAPLPCKP